MERPAVTDSPLIEPIRQRWSPYEFADHPVEPAKLRILFDAARWAANSFNEQPWRYIVATKDRPLEFETMLDCLTPGNQAWARFVPVLALSFMKKTFTYNRKPNRVALHDVGAASAHLTLQAEALGLKVHQMAGIEMGRIASVYRVPEEFEAVAGLAIGYPGHNPALPEEFRQRDRGQRSRKPFSEFVFSGSWENPAPLE